MKLKLSDLIMPALMVLGAAFGVYKMTEAYAASSPTKNYPSGLSANLSRPCDVEGQTTQTVAVSASSAATSSATVEGVIRVICTNASFMTVGAVGASPTATTSHVYIGQLVPEYFLSPGGKAAFIRVASDGSCYVTDCK